MREGLEDTGPGACVCVWGGMGYRISLEGVLWDVSGIGVWGFKSEGAHKSWGNLFARMMGVFSGEVHPGVFL